jgi:hypothetical protein
VFVTARTQAGADRAELLDELHGALTAVGIHAHPGDDALTVDGTALSPRLETRAHPTPAALAALVARPPVRLPALVVADRISDAGREVLRDAGWGWLDRRGHLRIWATGVRVETDFEAEGPSPGRVGNIWTTVGLEIAVAALCRPDEPVRARGIAGRIGRSVGSVHELISRFTEHGLIGPRTRLPLLPDLFWETSAHWPDDGWTPLPVSIEELAETLETSELMRVDERAATLAGARIPAVGDLPARCYVFSPGLLRRARALADGDRPTSCWVRPPPTRWLPAMPDAPPDPDHPWTVAHPVVSALRLAIDPARGREIVESWGIVPTGGS